MRRIVDRRQIEDWAKERRVAYVRDENAVAQGGKSDALLTVPLEVAISRSKQKAAKRRLTRALPPDDVA